MENKSLHQELRKNAQAEKASNSYLMSMVAIMGGLFLPLLNLLATLIFYMANRKESAFVKWHCTQALLSQALLFVMNSVAIGWLISIVFGSNSFNNVFFAYVLVALIFNLIEFIATIYTAIYTRKGLHVEWFFLGALANMITGKPEGIHPDEAHDLMDVNLHNANSLAS